MEASSEQLKQLQERRWDAVEILVIYIDGQRFASHHILSAVGVDIEGKKHILGIEPGATENAAAVKRLLTRLRDQGQIASTCSLSMAPRRCDAPLTKYSVPTSRCRGAEITSSAM